MENLTTLDLIKTELEDMNKILYGTSFEQKNADTISEAMNLIKTIMNKQIVEDISEGFMGNLTSYVLREHAIKYMGFALLTKKFTRSLAKYIGDKKCLEIMAGQGCLSKSLQDEGVDIIATDNYSWSGRLNMNETWTDIEDIDCLEAIIKYGKEVSYILCSWIPYQDSIGYKALKLMHEINPDCKMIVIGEGYGGCTADDLFFEHIKTVEENEEFMNNFKSWYHIHDYVSVVKYTDNNEREYF